MICVNLRLDVCWNGCLLIPGFMCPDLVCAGCHARTNMLLLVLCVLLVMQGDK